MLMKALYTILVFFSLATPPVNAAMPAMTAEKELLPLTRLAVDVKIHGFIAETRMTMTFGNRHNRPLAGDLYFPLPEGATVSGYALDVNGVMVDGVAVEREKARVVYEKEVRKGIDPGLVESVAGNNFKTRVFPVPANGSRTVMVRYITRLGADKGLPVYELPLHFSKPVGELSMRIEVIKPVAVPQIRRSSLANLKFGRWNDSYVAETRLNDIAPDDSLVIDLPQTGHAVAVAERATDGSTIIAMLDSTPPLPPSAEIKAPQHVTIFWDASGSRGEVDHAAELSLLKRFFARFPNQKIEVSLITFSNRPDKARKIVIANGDVAPLIKELAKVTYDGGTSLQALDPLLKKGNTDIFLLFSDALANLDGQGIPKPSRPLYAVSDDPRANHRLLRQISGNAGGAYLNLASIPLAEAVTAIGAPPVSLQKVLVESGKLSGIYPAEGAILPGGPFILTARLESTDATVTLVYGAGGREIGRRTFTIAKETPAAGGLTELLWAQSRLEDLLVFPDQNKKEILETGKRYGLVTPQTSLIVLETAQQYITHRIAPPASLPDMLKQYHAAIQNQQVSEKSAKEVKRNSLLTQWQQRVAELNRHYNYEPGFRYSAKSGMKQNHGSHGISGAVGGNFAPSDAARPSPMPSPQRIAEEAISPRAEAPALRTMAKRARNGADKKDALISGSDSTGAQIAIPSWDPATPWLVELKKTPKDEQYSRYLELRQKHGKVPGFYLDCADFFLAKGDQATGIRILTNLAELELENPALLRIMGYRLAELKMYDQAAVTFEQLLRLRPEEGVSWRDLAMVLADRAELQEDKGVDTVAADYSRAISLYNHLIFTPWARNNRTELVALAEVNRIIPKARRAGVRQILLDPAFITPIELDLRIVIGWDRDMTDLDLHVIEPSGEEAYYSHNKTTIGGLVSFDVTGGYGPEEYLLRKGMDGKYRIAVKYYGANNPSVSNSAVVRVDIFTNYGRSDEKRHTLLRRLEGRGEMIGVGEITLGK